MKSVVKDKVLGKVFLPILLETILLMLSGIADTLMISNVSDAAVGAVGTANTYIGLVFALFMIVSNGLIAVMTQYIGANKKGYAYQARNLSILLNGLFGLSISLILVIWGGPIITGFGIAENLKDGAILYLRIVGAACVLDALISVFSCYLKAFDKAQYSLISVISGNIVNLILNSIFIFVCHFGVLGVACSTVIGKFVNISLATFFCKKLVNGKQYTERTTYKSLIKQILRVGVPGALESTMYSIMMTVVVMFLARMDTDGFNATAKTYATQVTNFSYCVGLALAQATVIINGWMIGDNRVKDCYFQTHKAAITGIICGVVFELIFAIVSPWMLRIFTSDEELIRIVRIVLYIDVVIEAGKATSLVYGMTLKATGDSIFPTVIAFIFNITFAIGGSYLFGIVLDMGVRGVYVALFLDECTRATLLFIRFKTGKWEKKILTKGNNESLATV